MNPGHIPYQEFLAMQELMTLLAQFDRNADHTGSGGAGPVPVEPYSNLQVDCEVLTKLVGLASEVFSQDFPGRSDKLNTVINNVITIVTNYILYSVDCIATMPNNAFMTFKGKVSTFVRSRFKVPNPGKLLIEINIPGVTKAKFAFDDVASSMSRLFVELGAFQSYLARNPQFEGLPPLTVPRFFTPLVEDEDEEESQSPSEGKPALRTVLDDMTISLVQTVVAMPNWHELTIRERSILFGRVTASLGLSMPNGHDKSRTPGKGGKPTPSKPMAKKALSKEEKELADVQRRIRLEKERVHGELPKGNPLLIEYKSILDRIRAAKSH